MEQITINNTSELLAFIKKDEVTVEKATEIVRKALNVLIIAKNTKDQLIAETQYYVDNYCQNNKTERPLFLEMNLFDIGTRKLANEN
jgi:uncharacterized protein (DUF427 family)